VNFAAGGVCQLRLNQIINMARTPAREHPRYRPGGCVSNCHAILVRAKREIARGINSAALMADSKQTELCTYLSAILVGGLLLNALLGWWWADPVAALIMVPIIVKEGIEGLRGETCCDDECH
jgi:hypothetical protein